MNDTEIEDGETVPYGIEMAEPLESSEEIDGEHKRAEAEERLANLISEKERLMTIYVGALLERQQRIAALGEVQSALSEASRSSQPASHGKSRNKKRKRRK